MDWTITICFYLIAGIFGTVNTQEDNPRNEVIGQPIVSCAADAIYVKFRTKTTFLGHVDVKYTADKACFQSLVTNNQIEVLVPHEECMVARRRSLHPIGVILEIALTVSFHAEFTTADDRVFNLQCFHQNKANASLQIGSPTPPPADSTRPTCEYTVRSYPGGPPVGRLALGQSVYHSWECENIGEHQCLLVENCELIGGDQRHLVIDSDGCSRDESIMPQLQYHNQSYAGALVKVFGVSHTPIVYFSCQIRLESKNPSDQCPIPDCDQHRFKRDITSNLMEVRSQNLEISQLVNITNASESENVSCEITNHPDHPITHESQPHSDRSEEDDYDQICAEFRSVLITFITLIMGSIIVSTVVVFLVVRRQKYEIASMS